MISLRESLQEMVDVSANKVLTCDGTVEGKQALVRMTLLLSMLERLDAGGGSWNQCDLIPESIPVLSGIEYENARTLPQ